MTKFIMSVVGIVFLGVMVDVIVPEGKTNAFIKSMFSLVLLYVIMSSIANVIFNKKQIIDSFNVNLNEDFLEDLSSQNINNLEMEIIKAFEENGIMGAFVEIKGYMYGNVKYIEEVKVDISNLVITSEDKHINKYKLITSIIQSVVEVDTEVIVYDE